MPICTCPCPLHAAEGGTAFDIDAFWASVNDGKPKLDNSPARLVFMGDGRVGTSSLIKRFTRGQYDTDYKPEVAKVMRHTKDVFTPRLDTSVTVQFWDIEGSNVRTSLLCAQKAHAVAVVYDITNRSSFELAQRLLDGINPRASVLLIANKLDLKVHRKVSYLEGRILSKIHRVKYLEISAKMNIKVDEAFSIMVDAVPDEYLRSGSRNSAGMVATRRWQVSAAVCSMCSQKMERSSKLSRSASKEESKQSDLKHTGSVRRRARSDPQHERSAPEKTISI